MNLRNLVFVLVIATAISATLFYQQEDTAPTITSSPPLIDKPVAQSATEKIPKIEATGIDWDAIKERSPDEGFTAEEEAAFNELHVLPLNWIDQHTCTLEDYEGCEKSFLWKYPPSPYQTIDLVELEELAYSDPLAALMMWSR